MNNPVVHNTSNGADFEALFNNAPMGILVTNFEGAIITINRFALGQLGYESAHELLGKNVELLIPHRYRDLHTNHHETYFRNPETRPMGIGRELFAVKKDGTEIPVEISLSFYSVDDTNSVIAFITDISVRKKAEEQIRQANLQLENKVTERTEELSGVIRKLEEQVKQTNEKDALLQKTNKYLNNLLSHAGAMITVVDKDGIIQLFNSDSEKQLGYSSDEVIGKKQPLIFHDKNQLKSRSEKITKELGRPINPDMQVFTSKADTGNAYTDEWIYIKKNGRRFPVLLTVTSLKDEQNNIIGHMGIAFDITERKNNEENLRIALDKEKELGELKSRFVSMASHEFRTPLSTILSSAYLIEKYKEGSDQQKREKHLQRIISSVNMLTDTLNDFLSVGKIEEGKIQVRISEFNLRDLVITTAADLKNSLRKSQKIRYEHDGDTMVTLDPSLFKHILQNLISNASKFSPEKSPIEIRTECNKGRIVLKVKDYGIGISKEDQKHLMNRFFRGANAGNIQGTGLGLHIISKYAELMNGTVRCESELEKGTEFAITFTTKTGMYEKNIID
jgi:PAS domain S-box-containing protein